ncbi:MAG: hypothetical protein HY007_00285 [Candidatus Sungbacteria bacterium]|nr:hypothetical protein [Candidatus Sungbacteria bacterium]
MNKYIFSHPTSLDHYVADAFVVRCFDNRFWGVFHKFIKAQNLKHIDLESVAGGAKIFSSPEQEGDRDFMLRELEKSVKLHHTKKVMLFTHHDCGAYGGFAKFESDPEKEFAFHQSEHRKAIGAIQERFADIQIETYFIDDQGIIKILQRL